MLVRTKSNRLYTWHRKPPAGKTELNPKEVIELIEYEVGLMGRAYESGDSDATACQGFLDRLTELFIETESYDLSGIHELEDIRRALMNTMEDLVSPACLCRLWT